VALGGAARAEFGRALREADRDYPNLARSYALVSFLLGRRDAARTWYARLLELAPGDATARARLELLEAP
jgi:hypothetical protein